MRALLLAAAIALSLSPSASADDGTLVIVHPENPASALSRDEVKSYLLQKAANWPDGEPVRLLLPDHDSPVFQSVLRVLDMDQIQWDGYWERQQAYGHFAPKTVSDELVIVRDVSKDLHALGVIAASTLSGALGGKVKVVFKLGAR